MIPLIKNSTYFDVLRLEATKKFQKDEKIDFQVVREIKDKSYHIFSCYH